MSDQTDAVRTKRRFRVVELREVAWLQLLDGKKSGLQFGIEYGGFRDELEEGAKIVATVESLNEKNTAWAIREIHKTDVQTTGGADD